MLSANVSAFSMRKAVGGGAAPVPYVLEMFLISGGGAGADAGFASGGGGPGEYKTHTITEPPAGLTYTIAIGAGGAQQTANSQGNYGATTSLYGGSGSHEIGNLFGRGGGGGSTNFPQTYGLVPSTAGGGGAGGGGQSGNPYTGAAHLNGFSGGDSGQFDDYPHYNAAGGAGTGGNGADGGSGANNAGAGGIGYQWLNGSRYGGGGGGAYVSRQSTSLGTVAAGGSGGGGAGGNANTSTSNNAVSGAANTGGGGGGGGTHSISPRALGGSGGSGVAIIRYQGEQRGTGGTITSSGGYTYHTFNSSGQFTTA